MVEIILASQSPRRKMLLEQFNIHFTCRPADIDERFLPEENTLDAVRRIARSKADSVCETLQQGLIIAADTVVVCDGEIMGKPRDEQDACQKLSRLSGREHQVITAICLRNAANNYCDIQDEITNVYFRNISEEEIKAYVSTGEPLDKAGAYAVQGMGAIFIEKIDGCFFNVVGLPIKNLYTMLKRQGVDLLGG